MQNQESVTDEISLKELIEKVIEVFKFLRSKWLIIALMGIVGGAIGLGYAWVKKPVYKAMVTFALEDDKQSGGGLSGALGLASSLGFDLGASAGGAFSGANLIELMKSRKMVEKALLNPINVGNDSITLADRLIEILGKRKKLEEEKIWVGKTLFPLVNVKEKFSLKQDSLLSILYQSVAGEKGILSVAQKDKKISIITVEVNSIDELFSKVFAESIVKEVSQFYIETKSRKARNNVAILQKQADSVRNELNQAITGVAVVSDNTFNLNPALNVNRVPSTKRQVDVQANTAILTQLVTNLELAKVALMKETPLIQLIDQPILPLKKDKPGKLKSLLLGGFLGVFLSALYILARRLFNNLMA
ncbi:MAG: lipopolysaccharide biosynthesis protein [Chitinophagaceae bacterium]|nr:lipopolysaccharide biosynthesis protein [Chitinophagaceae bacterium]MCA6494045.1 lipopolysaccharide biosynthesis protein [Chitinophagaceae bacterium]MCA6513967.1 lipopolysaccharide biosynthesis protein [Chitinophagaceae bacterium]